MGLFRKPKKKDEPDDRCCRCGRLIRNSKDRLVYKGKTYCRKCGKNERDWDELEFLELIDDD